MKAKTKQPDITQVLLRVAQALFFTLLFVTSGLYLAGLIQQASQTFFAGAPLEFRAQPWQTQNATADRTETFRPGDVLYAAADFKVGYVGQFRSQQRIVSLDDPGNIRRTPDIDTQISSGVYKTNARVITLPDDLPAGRYRVEGMSTLTSWMRSYGASWQTTPFTVQP